MRPSYKLFISLVLLIGVSVFWPLFLRRADDLRYLSHCPDTDRVAECHEGLVAMLLLLASTLDSIGFLMSLCFVVPALLELCDDVDDLRHSFAREQAPVSYGSLEDGDSGGGFELRQFSSRR